MQLEMHVSLIKPWQTSIWNWFGEFIGQWVQEGVTVIEKKNHILVAKEDIAKEDIARRQRLPCSSNYLANWSTGQLRNWEK